MTSAGSRKNDVTTSVETPESRKSSSHSAGLPRWLVSGNWPAKLGALLLVSIGAGILLCYLMLTFTLSRDTHGDLRPQIASATYTSPRNGLSFDFTTRIRSQCRAGVAGSVVVAAVVCSIDIIEVQRVEVRNPRARRLELANTRAFRCDCSKQ